MTMTRRRLLALAGAPVARLTPALAPRRERYDVCIVGSGAGGGMAAYALTQAGANVVLLEAGPEWYSERDSAMLTAAADSPRRGAATKERQFGEFDACIGGWEVDGEPYTLAPGHRVRLVARADARRPHQPLGAHLAPVRPRRLPPQEHRRTRRRLAHRLRRPRRRTTIALDRFIGIFGSSERLRNHPDGIFLPPPRPRCYELLVQQASRRLGIPCIPSRMSILTRPHNGRPACHYCGQCNRGCRVNANFSSPGVFIPPALDDRPAHARHRRDGARGDRSTRRAAPPASPT